MDLENENRITQEIIGAAIEVHRELGGPGLLESVYEEALIYELSLRGLQVGRQLSVPLTYKNKQLQNALRLDLLVENTVLVELKSVNELNPIVQSQVLTYIRLLNLKLGIVLNFGQPKLVDGVSRVINNAFKF
jgi:GxxExxY protein